MVFEKDYFPQFREVDSNYAPESDYFQKWGRMCQGMCGELSLSYH